MCLALKRSSVFVSERDITTSFRASVKAVNDLETDDVTSTETENSEEIEMQSIQSCIWNLFEEPAHSTLGQIIAVI